MDMDVNRRPDLDAAETFMWLNARLIDRHRFAASFRGGDASQVIAALRPYQNADGGFGQALEPDFRGPVSQPATVETALGILDEVDGFADPMVERACDYLLTITTPDGGVPFVLPSARGFPRAPWWETGDDPPGSLLPTAAIAGLLHKRGIRHRWIERATDFCWRAIANLDQTYAYELRAVLTFLNHVPDRARAEEAFARIGPLMFAQKLVALDSAASGEVHLPLEFAPSPQTMARRLFASDLIETHLDALTAAQQSDGGWTFNWPNWNPTTGLAWRGVVTLQALLTLRAYGRLT